MKYNYIAVLTPFDDGTGYTIEAPDVPGCVTSGKDHEDAVEMAKDALAGCLCVLEDHGMTAPPKRSSIDDIAAKCEFGKQKLAFVEVDTDEYRRECGE